MCARPRKSRDATSAGMFSFATFLLRQKKSRFNKYKKLPNWILPIITNTNIPLPQLLLPLLRHVLRRA